MHLVFLYGPPGVGKLSVAREVVARTGFRLFHNHLSIDLVASVFPRGTPTFGRLLGRFRGEMLVAAAREGVDLVFTYVYAHPDDEADVRDLVAPVQAVGGMVCFVQLTCARDALFSRVGDDSRRAHGKITDPALLAHLLDRHDLFSAVPCGDSLRIDTTHVSPADAAARIIAHFALPTSTPSREGNGPR